MSEFTPGPWRVRKSPTDSLMRPAVFGARHKDGTDYAAICEVANIYDAHLIAAAPEMHDSLEELGDVITRLIRGEPVRNLDEILLRRDLILKKAQGHGHE